jgi:hypothetical protein
VLPDQRYPDIAAQSRAVERIVEELSATPGVLEAGFVVGPPLRPDCCMGHPVVFEGREQALDRLPSTRVRPLHGAYLDALGIRVLEGRGPASTDVAGAEPVAFVNLSFAERHFPQGDALNQRIAWRPGDVTPVEKGPQWMRIAGIIDDVRADLRQGEVEAVYVPYLQRDQEWVRSGTLVARVKGAPMEYIQVVQQAVSRVDPRLPLQDIQDLPLLARAAAAGERFSATLASGFGLVSWILALQGVAAVLAFGVSQRQHELGIRAALGASSASLRSEVLKSGLRTTLIGLITGMLAAAVAARLLHGLTFQTSSNDPLSFAGAALAVMLGALLAAWWPARRAGRVDPMQALRHD